MSIKPILFYIKVVQVMVKKKISTSKTWVGGQFNRPGQVTPHPCTNIYQGGSNDGEG